MGVRALWGHSLLVFGWGLRHFYFKAYGHLFGWVAGGVIARLIFQSPVNGIFGWQHRFEGAD